MTCWWPANDTAADLHRLTYGAVIETDNVKYNLAILCILCPYCYFVFSASDVFLGCLYAGYL